MRPPGEDFSRHLHFRKQEFLGFFWPELQKDPDNEDQEGDQEYESVEEEVSQIFVV